MTTQQQKRTYRFNDINFIVNRQFFAQDLLRLCFGNKLGEGAYRAVFEFDLIPNTVIKVADVTKSNVLEYHVWEGLKNTSYHKWFAPCLFISPCGHFLIQKRVRPIKDGDKLPNKLPAIFTDIKKNNWGWIGKRLVCHDYQFIHKAFELGFNVHMHNVKWQ
ncbi:MAG: hypothetical protein JWO92_2553 [Chitinophagaceae bacterium]|nr:hypothetical protein [Chitinophagaceae bacterium]